MGWFWPSKEEIVQKNLQNHINRLEAEVKTLKALNLTDNNWAQQAINDLGNLNERNNITLQDLKKKALNKTNKTTLQDPKEDKQKKETPPAETLPAKTPPAETPSTGSPDLTAGGTRKKRKNKKHKKKTYRH